MSGFKPTPPIYDRRRLEQLVMQHRIKSLLQTKGGKRRGERGGSR